MHRLWWACVPLTLLASAGIVAQTSSPSTGAAREGTLVITGVSIVDAVRGTTSAPQDVVVEGGRIATIAPTGSVSAPSGATRVDGTGRFAIPGLIDVHAHFGEGESVRRTTPRVRVRSGSSSDMA
jgi:imidazolonepropionase-like amidohydrolase